jgi:hypothetical protein
VDVVLRSLDVYVFGDWRVSIGDDGGIVGKGDWMSTGEGRGKWDLHKTSRMSLLVC